MSIPSNRFAQLRWLQNVLCVSALLGSLVVVGLGIMGVGVASGSLNIWLIIVGAFTLFLTVLVMTYLPLARKMESAVARQLGELRDMSDVLTKQLAAMEAIEENTRLSDAAKSLAHRQQELEALRAAIREDLRIEHWEVALNLIDEMERRFGCKEEADRLREELDQARGDAIDAKLRDAIEMVDRHFRGHDWEQAQREIDRLLHALPDHAKVVALQDRMATMKETHKHELMLAWEEAVRRSDTDHAIDVLRELDQYLSSAEAQALQASARDVFKEKLLQMGVKFRFAVTEKRWQDALTIGLELVREFPNARMATEVRDVIDTLRERARANAEMEAGSVREVSP